MTFTSVPGSKIAVSAAEHEKWGCAHCGYRSGYCPISGRGTAIWSCGECGETTIILMEGLTKSTIGSNDAYPELQEHPRKGTPSHGTPDKKPESGGEFYHPRGVGNGWVDDCYACGANIKGGVINDLAAFVQNKTAGERVVALFDGRAKLDYRPSEPDRVQVKIGCCKDHLPQLNKLYELTREPGIITRDIIEQSKGAA